MLSEMKRVLKKGAIGEEEDLKDFYKQIDEEVTTRFREIKKHNKTQWKVRRSLSSLS